VVRKLDDNESAQRIHWLSDTWPPMAGGTGFDEPKRWQACAWVQNAIYERDDVPAGLSYDDVRGMVIDAGAEEPTLIGGVNLDDATVTTGVSLGFVEKPAQGWRRLTWSALGRRDGFGYWAVDGRWPDLHYTPQADWADPDMIPTSSRPATGPVGGGRWPVDLQTPPEVYSGDLVDLPSFVRAQRGTRLTPSNIWPADRSWFVYTDYDLWTTRVCGSASLIDVVMEDGALDAVRCG
jgi:hypothetical protein